MSDQSWQRCPEGEILSMANGLRNQSQRRTLLVSSVAVGIVLIATTLALVTKNSGPKNQPILLSITCTECLKRYDDYEGGRLSQDQLRQVDAHLEHCSSCRRAFEARRQKRVAS